MGLGPSPDPGLRSQVLSTRSSPGLGTPARRQAHTHTHAHSHAHCQSPCCPPGTPGGGAARTSCPRPRRSAGGRGQGGGARRAQGRGAWGLGARALPLGRRLPPLGQRRSAPFCSREPGHRPQRAGGGGRKGRVPGDRSRRRGCGRAEEIAAGAAGTGDPARPRLGVGRTAQRPRPAAGGCSSELQAKFSAVPLGAGRGLGVAAAAPRRSPGHGGPAPRCGSRLRGSGWVPGASYTAGAVPPATRPRLSHPRGCRRPGPRSGPRAPGHGSSGPAYLKTPPLPQLAKVRPKWPGKSQVSSCRGVRAGPLAGGGGGRARAKGGREPRLRGGEKSRVNSQTHRQTPKVPAVAQVRTPAAAPPGRGAGSSAPAARLSRRPALL